MGGVRRDAFGFIDYIALDGKTFVAIQSTGQGFSPHHKKMMGEATDYIQKWLAHDGRVILIGWRKLKKKKGGKQMVWKPRIREYYLEDGEVTYEDWCEI